MNISGSCGLDACRKKASHGYDRHGIVRFFTVIRNILSPRGTDGPGTAMITLLLMMVVGTLFMTRTGEAAGPLTARTLAEPLRFLITRDGLSIGLGKDGGISSVAVEDIPLSLLPVRSGLSIEDVANGRTWVISGAITRTDQGLRSKATSEEHQLAVDAHYRVYDHFISIEGIIESTTARDRVINLVLSMPVDASGWMWWRNLNERDVISGGTAVFGPKGLKEKHYPFAVVTNTGKRTGIGMAVSADVPCLYEISYDAFRGLSTSIRLGMSPDGSPKLKNRASFRILLFRVDPAWGFRDAARRYYDAFPQAFQRRVARDGLWLFVERSGAVPNPQHYAFRETGTENWEEDDRLDVLTFTYIIPGQRELKHLKALPHDSVEAIQVTTEHFREHGDKAELRDVIENSSLADAAGGRIVIIRNTSWGGNSITYPLNPDPALFAGTGRKTSAGITLSQVRDWLHRYPGIDGIYVDSLWLWGEYWNYRKEHFAFARSPLAYQEGVLKPAIHNSFSHQEFLKELADLLHSSGKYLFCNGIRIGREFNSYTCDILGIEGNTDLRHLRTIAYQKPALRLVPFAKGDREKVERIFRECAALGIFPSMDKPRAAYEEYRTLFDVYVPLIQKLSSAGWEPVTYASSTDPDVIVERFGKRNGDLFLTVYNTARQKKKFQLSFDQSVGVFTRYHGAQNLFTGKTYRRDSTLPLDILPGELLILKFT
jgi:hypothetical protein